MDHSELSIFQQVYNLSYLKEPKHVGAKATTTESNVTENDINAKHKKRNLYQLVEGHYEETVKDLFKVFTCKFCSKDFFSEQVSSCYHSKSSCDLSFLISDREFVIMFTKFIFYLVRKLLMMIIC
jgi:hypothetical protein